MGIDPWRLCHSPEVAFWVNDHWVAGSKGHVSSLIAPHCPMRLLGPLSLDN